MTANQKKRPAGGQAETNFSTSKKQDKTRRRDNQAEPEFGNSRRRFLIAMFMGGYVSGDRIIERVVGELEDETL